MIYILIAPSLSGKDYIMKHMVEDCNINPIISYTTRPIRINETNGVEYKFISKEQFEYMIKNDLLIEYRTYNTLVNNVKDTWYYGLMKEIFSHELDYVVILDVNGANNFIKYYGANYCKVIYINCDKNVRRERASMRGDYDATEFRRRLKADEIDFAYDKLVTIVDKFVDNTNTNVDDLVKEIIE